MRCPNCCSFDVASTRLVEMIYLHPLAGLILGLAAAGLFAVNTRDFATSIFVAVGISVLPLLGPIRKRHLGLQGRCNRCDHSWTRPGEPAGRQPGAGSWAGRTDDERDRVIRPTARRHS